MRESHLGIIASIAVHSFIIPLLVAASFALDSRPGKVLEIDFSLIKDREIEQPASETRKQGSGRSAQIRTGEAESGKTDKRAGSVPGNMAAFPAKERVDRPAAPTDVTASDPRSDTVVHGTEATFAESPGITGSLHGDGDGVGAGGRGRGGHGAGPGNGPGVVQGGRDYNYIRDAVMRNIKYPDEAIRLGIEGRVLISFIVLENGTTSNIEIVNGSGYRLLDDNARGAVAITRIHKKVPYRVVVHLPVTYKLRG